MQWMEWLYEELKVHMNISIVACDINQNYCMCVTFLIIVSILTMQL